MFNLLTKSIHTLYCKTDTDNPKNSQTFQQCVNQVNSEHINQIVDILIEEKMKLIVLEVKKIVISI